MRITVSALLLAAVVQYTATPALAQHLTLQHFDDLTFAAISDARDLRWEIRDHFAQSRDRDHLLHDVQALIEDLQDLQRSIFQEKSPRALDRDLDVALKSLGNLKEHLLGCDYAMYRPAAYQPIPRGYTFAPQTIHPGRAHVDHAVEMLMAIDRKLQELHVELTGAPVIHPSPGHVMPTPQPQLPPLQVPSGPVYYPGNTNLHAPALQIQSGKIKFQVKN